MKKTFPSRVRLRFGLSTMMAMTAVFAVMFAFLQALELPGIVYLLVAGWCVAVGLGQALLFRGRKPRKASLIVGGCASLPVTMVLLGHEITQVARIDDRIWILVLGGLFLIPIGTLFGYLVGCLAAGIFMFTERGIRQEEEDDDEIPTIEPDVEPVELGILGFPMTNQPTFDSQRLILRPLIPTDAEEIQRLAGDREVAATTLRIPHPYPDGAAEKWIAMCLEQFEDNHSVTFGIILQSEARLIGSIGLDLDSEHARGEMGYWIGKDYWNQGFATEAASAMLRYGFEQLELNRMVAHCFLRNRASARVLEKLQMSQEGVLREHVKKWGQFEDVDLYAILRRDWTLLQP